MPPKKISSTRRKRIKQVTRALLGSPFKEGAIVRIKGFTEPAHLYRRIYYDAGAIDDGWWVVRFPNLYPTQVMHERNMIPIPDEKEDE